MNSGNEIRLSPLLLRRDSERDAIIRWEMRSRMSRRLLLVLQVLRRVKGEQRNA